MAMTVRELIAALQDYPPDTLVVLSEDSEGNGHSPLHQAADGTYVPTSTWSGDLYAGRTLTPELIEAGYGDDDVHDSDDTLDVVVLWPTR